MQKQAIMVRRGEHGSMVPLSEIVEGIRSWASAFMDKQEDPHLQPLDDWLQEQRRLVYRPETHLQDDPDEIRVVADVAGFQTTRFRVIVRPRSIEIAADQTYEVEPGGHMGVRRLFAKVDLPCEIVPTRVEARLKSGILKIRAPKSYPDFRRMR